MADIAPSSNPMNDLEISADVPVTEALLTKIGANINALLRGAMPVGTLIHSDLDEFSFQSEMGGTHWVLCDGRSVVGSRYATLTGLTTVPDRRGLYLRGKNYARSTANGQPEGDLPVGTYLTDMNQSHTHDYQDHGQGGPNTFDSGGARGVNGDDTRISAAQGGAESRPRSSISNIFVRIN